MEITRIKEKNSLHTFKDSTSLKVLLRIIVVEKKAATHFHTDSYLFCKHPILAAFV